MKNSFLIQILMAITILTGCVAGDVGQDKNQLGSVGAGAGTGSLSYTSPSPTTTAVGLKDLDSAQVFNISVSNPKSASYTNTWKLNGNSAPFSTTSTNTIVAYSFDPSIIGVGSHVLEAHLSSNGEVIDKQSWVVVVTAATRPTINAPTPASGATILDHLPNPSITASITNPDALNFNFRWKVNGVIELTGASIQSATTHTPGAFAFNLVGANTVLGANTVSFEVIDDTSPTPNVYATYSWSYTVQRKPSFNTGTFSPALGTIVKESVDATQVLSVPITNPSSLAFHTTWKIDNTQVLTIANTNPSVLSVDFHPTTENLALAAPQLTQKSAPGYDITLILSSEAGGTGTIYDQVLSTNWYVRVDAPSTLADPVIVTSPVIGVTTIHAVDEFTFVNGAAGIVGAPIAFFTDGTNDSRGTPMNFATSANDFCMQINDVVDVSGGATLKVVFIKRYGAVESIITPPLPVGTSITLANTDVCLSNIITDTTFNYDLTNGATQYLKAVVYDGAAGDQVAKSAEWTINVEAKNTAPTITHDTTCTNCVANFTPTVTQDQVATPKFAFTLIDKDGSMANTADFAVTFKVDGTNISTANNFPATGTAMPDCEQTVAEAVGAVDGATYAKYTCSLNFPSYGTAGSLAPGSYTITGYITDVVNFTGGVVQSSNVLSWAVTVNETNTAPVIANLKIGVGCSPTAASDTYIHAEGVNTDCIITAAEDNTLVGLDGITFNLSVTDAERDSFKRTLEYEDPANPGIFLNISGPTTFAKADDVTPTITTYTYTLPQTFLDGVALTASSKSIDFRITVEDIPGTVGALQDQETITLTINNTNPAPIITGGAESPVFTSDSITTRGTLFVADPGTVTDASVASSDGDTIAYQWQYSTTAGCAAGYANITGATSKALGWTPPDSLAGSNICLRVCVGDDGYTGENPPDCTGTVGGPWLGSGSNGTTTARAAQTTIGTGTGDAATFAAGNISYVARASGTDIVLTQNTLDGTTGLVAVVTETQTTDPSTATNEAARNLSITSDGTYIWVAYMVDDADLLAPAIAPVIRIRRYTVGAIATTSIVNINIISGGIGKVSTNGTNWYLPYIDTGNSAKLAVAYQAVATPTTYVVTQMTTSSVVTSNIMNAVDTTNDELILALKNPSGNFNLYSYDISGVIADTTTNSQTDIFTGFSTLPYLTVGSVTNPYVFIGMKNTSNQLVVNRYDLNGFANGVTGSPVNNTIPQINNFDALALVAGSADKELWAATVLTTNAYLTKVTGVTPTATTIDVSSQINLNTNSVTSTGTNLMSLSPTLALLDTGGTSGSGDPTNDSVHLTFYDGTNVQSVLVNIESESTLTSHSGGTGAGWTVPFFK